MIGERIVKLPHPAARIVGAVLVVGGNLTLTYIAVDDAVEKMETIKLTSEEATRLEEKRKLAFVREDGKIEERPIDKVQSAGDK